MHIIIIIGKKNDIPKVDVLDFFDKNKKISRKGPDDSTNDLKKSEILDKFLKIVDPLKVNTTKIAVDNKCSKCNIEKKLIAAEGILVCTTCGETTNILIDSDKPNYRDPPPEINYFLL